MTRASVRSLSQAFGRSTLRVEYGSITAVDAEVLVSSDDVNLSMSGGVSLVLLDEGGESIYSEAQQQAPQPLGGVAVTSAGRLKAKKIFHAAVLDYVDKSDTSVELIRRVTRTCLSMSDRLGFTSIRFPALGTGAAGLSAERAAFAMMMEIASYLSGPTQVRSVSIALFPRFNMYTSEVTKRFFAEASEFLELIRRLDGTAAALEAMEHAYRDLGVVGAAKIMASSRQKVRKYRTRWEKALSQAEPGSVQRARGWLGPFEKMESEVLKAPFPTYEGLLAAPSSGPSPSDAVAFVDWRAIELRCKEERKGVLRALIAIRARDLDQIALNVALHISSVSNTEVGAVKKHLQYLKKQLAGLEKTASAASKRSVSNGSVRAKASVIPATLFSWIHLSDVHFGHKSMGHQWDQTLVLDALRKDIAEHTRRGTPSPGAILVTGDIAFSGTREQYDSAQTWLLDLAKLASIDPDQVFLVPGNHDVNRSVDTTNRNVARLLRALRDGPDDIDEILSHPEDKALLASRMAPYLAFASSFPSLQTPDPLFWSYPMTTPSGLCVRLIGLNTALLAADDLDNGKLRLGKQALARTLTSLPDNELTLILSHHPFRNNWLADQSYADSYIKVRARIHLSGHVHEADSEESWAGSGTNLIRITAGAVHGDKLPPGIPASHGYSFAAVVPGEDGTLRLRIWPRRWSEKNKRFAVDTDNTPDDRPYAEHTIPGMSFKP